MLICAIMAALEIMIVYLHVYQYDGYLSYDIDQGDKDSSLTAINIWRSLTLIGTWRGN